MVTAYFSYIEVLKMKKLVMMSILALFSATIGTAQAQFTIKSGQVLSSDDGKVYEGASPKEIENIMANAKRGGKSVGSNGANVFVVVGETITFVNTDDLKGKTTDEMKAIVGDAVVENVTGVEGLTLEEMESISDETGIATENLEVIEQIAANLPEDMVEDMIAGIKEAVDAGLADEINTFISELSEDEIGLLQQFSSLEECQAAGASGCAELDAKMNEVDF